MPTNFLEIIMRSTKPSLLTRNYISILRTGSLAIGLILCLCGVSLIAVRASGDDVVSRIEANLAGAAINVLVPRGEAETKTFVNGNREFEVHVSSVNLADGTVLK